MDIERMAYTVAGIAPAKVKIVKAEIDHGDKRSYGHFHVEAETDLGLLVGEGNIGSGGETDDEKWTLAGAEVDKDADLPDLGIPHAYAGSRAIARFEKSQNAELTEALGEWLAGYKVFLEETGIQPGPSPTLPKDMP